MAGPREVSYGPDELLAICVVRNGAVHVRSFLDHHLGLGVRHIVLLDNGSTDGTIDLARGYENVTILRTDCPYRLYENVMKRYLARRFSRGRWNLCVDIDERFDYPLSDVLPLPSFLAYLDYRGFTAVVAQMLDLFPDAPLLDEGGGEAGLRERHRFYDTSTITRREYRYGTLANPEVREHRGGIRRAVFQSNNCLTKAALVRVDEEIELFADWHHVRNARIADLTCVLLHYPFVETFAAKVEDAVRTGRYGTMTTPQYESYWRALREDPGLRLKGPAAREYAGTAALVEEGFLVISRELQTWVAEHGSPKGLRHE
ncbi:MAG TPA: glycosyltransferase family 2 protein [Thermoanaerobaculia bacterium]|nr:glycosyltransferase family 2 protein [Thermoanaerobaculia bacterium]